MTGGTLLFRQVNPSWMQQGRATSQVFRPTPKDQKHLSVYDGDQITAERAWVHFTGTLGFSSVGILAVTVQECSEQGLPAIADPQPFPEHVIVDYSGFSENEIRSKAKRLKATAETRGWQYRVDNGA